MSFFDDLLRTLRAPLDFVRGKTSAVRSAEGQMFGNVNRVKNLPREMKGELDYNRSLVKSYGDRGKRAKNWAQGKKDPQQLQQGAPSPTEAPRKAKTKMGLFSKKRRCPGCNEKLDARWELCPYCGFGASDQGEAPQQQGGPPRTQALDIGANRDLYSGNQGNYGSGGYDHNSNGSGNKPRTMALDIGSIPQQHQQPQSSRGGTVAWIIPLDGPQGGQLIELRSRAIVGTAPDCDVVVKDSSVSGRHAEFVAQGGGFRVSDLGSTNGTYVNDKRVSNAELVDGDTLRLGRTPFKFKST